MAIPTSPPDIVTANAAARARLRPRPAVSTVPPLRPNLPAARPAPQVPLWQMTPQALQALALKQAQSYYQPLIDEYHRQQTAQQQSAAAAQAGLIKLVEVLQGAAKGLGGQIGQGFDAASALVSKYANPLTTDLEATQKMYEGEKAAYADAGTPQAQLIGLAGQTQYLTALQDQQKITEDMNAKLAELQSQIPQEADRIYQSYQGQISKAQASSLAERQFQFKKFQYSFTLAQRQVADLNKGPWLYYVATGADGYPEVRLAKDKKGKPISTQGMTPYQKAQLTARAAASRETHQYHQTQAQLQQQRIDASKQKAAAAGKGKAPTPNQISTLVQGWYTGKAQTTPKQVGTDKNGNPVYRRVPAGRTGQLSYQQAYRRLRALNVPDQQARQVLDTAYKRGERGRPWVNALQRSALRKAGVYPNAGYLTTAQAKAILAGLPAGAGDSLGNVYLMPEQVSVLERHGMLPPGEWVSGGGVKNRGGASLVRIYLIDPGY